MQVCIPTFSDPQYINIYYTIKTTLIRIKIWFLPLITVAQALSSKLKDSFIPS